MQIIQDTREQIPFNFSFYPECEEVIVKCLKTGDYSLVGYEDKVYIERKRSTSELAINLGTDKVRFFKELERMEKVKWKFVICEFSIDDILSFPKNSTIPRNRWATLKFTGKAIYTLMKQAESKFGVKFIFCDNPQEAAEEVINIFKKVEEHYKVGF